MAEIGAIVNSSDWVPLRYDALKRTVIFAHLPRSLRRTLPFINEEHISAPPNRVAIELDTALSALDEKAKPISFIFHSAFCASTLLIRALDASGQFTGLSEPQILNDIARPILTGEAGTELLRATLALLARSGQAGEPIVIKPTNEVNFLILDILRLIPNASALFISAPLRGFVGSIATKGLRGRCWVRHQYRLLRQYVAVDPGFSEGEIFEQTDLQIAGIVWLMNRWHFSTCMARNQERSAGLMSNALTSQFEPYVRSAGKLFGVELGPHALMAAVRTLSIDSKTQSASFDSQRRSREYASLGTVTLREIEAVESWVTSVAKHVGLAIDLARPLPIVS